jgi:alanyl aminopeptidase
LNTAAYYGDKSLFDRLVTEFKKTQDRPERELLLDALSSFRDPAAIQAGKQMLISDEIPFNEGVYSLLFAGGNFPTTRALPFEFFKTHYDEILAKRTGGVFDAGAYFPYVGAPFCDSKSEAEYKAFFEPRLDSLLGSRHTFSEMLDRIHACIAFKAAQGAGVAAFLAKY